MSRSCLRESEVNMKTGKKSEPSLRFYFITEKDPIDKRATNTRESDHRRRLRWLPPAKAFQPSERLRLPPPVLFTATPDLVSTCRLLISHLCPTKNVGRTCPTWQRVGRTYFPLVYHLFPLPPLFLCSAPKKYVFTPTTDHYGAQKEKKKTQTSRTQSVKLRFRPVSHLSRCRSHSFPTKSRNL